MYDCVARDRHSRVQGEGEEWKERAKVKAGK